MDESRSDGQQKLGQFARGQPAEEVTEGGGSTAVPPRCLSFEIRGPFAHFRRVEGNVVKQTYRLMPRTTLAGMIAAMLGLPRDSYYQLFGPETSSVAIQPLGGLRTMNLPELTLTTTNNNDTMGLESHGSRSTVKITIPRPEAARQQHNYEVLVDPEYRVDIWLADEEHYAMLRKYLRDGYSHYTPSLGLSEHLAEVEFIGEYQPTGVSSDVVNVDSAVPSAIDNIVAEPGIQWSVERSPAFMEARDRGRVTTGFQSYAFRPDGGKLTVRDVEPAHLDGRTVLFA
jgi:CRISPR-associated protein Cas5h